MKRKVVVLLMFLLSAGSVNGQSGQENYRHIEDPTDLVMVPSFVWREAFQSDCYDYYSCRDRVIAMMMSGNFGWSWPHDARILNPRSR